VAEPVDFRTTVELERFELASFAPGKKHSLWLHAFDELSGPVLLPGLVVRGARPGPLLLAIAGVHGDEYEGMEAIRQCVDALDPDTLTGTFIGIPVANPFAYAARCRATPAAFDGLNLARVFPGDPAGTPTRRLADALLRFVARLVGPDDCFIDFHSGSADADYATVVGVRDVPGTERSQAIARAFGISRLWLIPDSTGPFNAETARRGIPTIGTETTGRAGCLAADVAAYLQGLHNTLAFLGMALAPQPVVSDAPFSRTVDLVAPLTGFFRTEKQLYDAVEKGERIGVFIDLFGAKLAEFSAPVAGEIWAMRATPAVRSGELLGMIAVVTQQSSERNVRG